jgi:hypothetical protein
MKKIQLIIISLTLLCPLVNVTAQDRNELVLQMSQPYSGGTARMLGLGGSKVALGADAGNLYLNPASLGFYNRSEWVFTPSLNYIGTSTEYLGNTISDNKLNFNFANLGVVFNRTKQPHEEGKWRGGSIGFSMNRINNHHFDATYQGYNPNQDIIDYAVEQDNFFVSNDITDLLFNTTVTSDDYIIYGGEETIFINGFEYDKEDLFGSNIKSNGGPIIDNSDLQPGDSLSFVNRNIYRTGTGAPAFPSEDNPVFQREEVKSRGSEYAASISYGGNYDDKIYFGAGVNIMTIDKEIERVYTEQPTNADLSQLTFIDNYVLTGSGVNVSLGIIARPVQSILVGLSYTSPTFYGMEESREFEMLAEFPDFGDETDQVIHPSFGYNLTLPSKFRGGLTFFFGKNGFLTADIETTNTSNALFKNGYDGYSFEEENRQNRRLFSKTVNVGVGGEYRRDIFRFRGGFNYITDPSESQNPEFNRMMYALGVGLRKKDFFIDLAYNYFTSNQLISPYPTAEQASMSKSNSMTSVSIGFNF